MELNYIQLKTANEARIAVSCSALIRILRYKGLHLYTLLA